MKIKNLFIVATLFVISLSSSLACTVWGVIKPEETIIAKNRDFYPGNQKMMTISHPQKYKYFGLYGDNEYDHQYNIKMGINEKGLVVFMTFASTIPLKQRVAPVPYYQVMENILQNYSSVDEIDKDSQLLFHDITPINYIFADRHKTMLCEIGLNNNYKCNSYSRVRSKKVVTFSQTNHYIIPELRKYNLTSVEEQQTSYFRLKMINKLMKSNLADLNFERFVQMSFNTIAVNDNPLTSFDTGYNNTYQDNSIFRTFNSHPDRKNKEHPNSDQSVSTMIIKLPLNENEPVELYWRIIDKIIDLNDEKYTQQINYSEATATLDKVINNFDQISYLHKSCKRDINSRVCA